MLKWGLHRGLHRALRPHSASGVCSGRRIGVCSGRRIGVCSGRRHVVLAEELQDLTDHVGAHVPARVGLSGEAEGEGFGLGLGLGSGKG